MKSLLQPTLVSVAVAVAVVASGMPAVAEIVALKADLKASNEVPPNKSTGTGSITVTYDPAEKMLSWKGSYAGLSGPVIAAHFHGPAEIGWNAGIAVGIALGNTAGAFEGSTKITDSQASELIGGRWYVNLHTAANPAGEIRGQVVK